TKGFFPGKLHFSSRTAKNERTRILYPLRHGFTLCKDCCTFRQSVLDMALNLFDGRMIDHRPDSDTQLSAITHLHRPDALAELFSKGIIDPSLNQNAVGADTGLATIAEFRNHRTFNRHIEISIVKHDERRIASQFE